MFTITTNYAVTVHGSMVLTKHIARFLTDFIINL